jgi:hypothetical protein
MSTEGVEITLRDVYTEQRHTSEQMAALTTQVATFVTRVDARLDSGQARMEDHEQRLRLLEGFPKVPADHEGRLRALERFRYTLMGAAVVLQVIGLVTEWVLGHLK